MSLAWEGEEEKSNILHQAFMVENWDIELHGTLRSQLGRRIDRVQDDTFKKQANFVSGRMVKQTFTCLHQTIMLYLFLPTFCSTSLDLV